MCKPIIKWVGGKRQLLNDIKKLLPKKFNNYFEPFIGGGALFFDLEPKNATISDYNKDLINLYSVVRDEPEKLLENIGLHKNEPDYYYSVRAQDRNEKLFMNLSSIEKASRFVFLNKTGFNGLYRVNSKGQCNVPFGRYKTPKYYDPDNIYKCNALLKTTKILNGDFEIIKDLIAEGDFIYFDPPYIPVNKTSNFTGYTDKGFNEEMQNRLKNLCDYITNIGAFFMLPNSYTEHTLSLYNEYNIHTVEANRNINSDGNGRGKIKEMLVTNY